jgi:hypothetical protein
VLKISSAMIRPLLLVALSALTLSHALAGGTAIEALNALPAHFRSDVLFLSADDGDPNPPAWYVMARNTNSLPTNIIVTDGRVTSQRVTLNPRALINGLVPIDLARVRVDSTGVWRTALSFSADRGRRLGSVSYQLQQRGDAADPIWSVWCYDRRGSYIGFFSALATTGAVISSR